MMTMKKMKKSRKMKFQSGNDSLFNLLKRKLINKIIHSQRRRVPVAKVKEEPLRPSSTTSNSSASSQQSTSNSDSVSGDNSLRRSGRIRRKPKRPFDSSEEEAGGKSEHKKRSVNTRNAGKRTVRYGESDDEAKKSSLQVRNRPSRNSGSCNSSRIMSDEDDENEDPCDKRQPNGAVKRHSRQSAQEAAKRLRTDFRSSDEDNVAAVPTNSVSSRGRVRKVVQYNTQEYFE